MGLTKQKFEETDFFNPKFIEMTEEETSFDPSLKKKKKKKKTPFDLDGALNDAEGDNETPEPAKDENLDDLDLENFGKKKKKRRRSAKATKKKATRKKTSLKILIWKVLEKRKNLKRRKISTLMNSRRLWMMITRKMKKRKILRLGPTMIGITPTMSSCKESMTSSRTKIRIPSWAKRRSL